MRFHRSFVVLVVAFALLCLPGAALAGPRGGARYDGKTATAKPVFLEVRKDGRRLGDWAFATRTTCSDRKRRLVGFVSEGERAVTVAADGSFSYTSRKRRTGQAVIRGRFDAAGNKVVGSFNIVQRGRRVVCSTGDVTYAMSRDGTPGAPYRNIQAASGLYVGNGRAVTVRMRPLLPAGLVHSVSVRYRTSCRSGKRRPGTDRVAAVDLTARNGFVASFHGRLRGKGVTVRHSFGVAGSFVYNGGYRVSGAIQVRNVFRRGRRVTDVCGANLPFTGLFKGGPLGEEGPHPTG